MGFLPLHQLGRVFFHSYDYVVTENGQNPRIFLHKKIKSLFIHLAMFMYLFIYPSQYMLIIYHIKLYVVDLFTSSFSNLSTYLHIGYISTFYLTFFYLLFYPWISIFFSVHPYFSLCIFLCLRYSSWRFPFLFLARRQETRLKKSLIKHIF